MLESFPDRGRIRFNKSRDAGGVMNATIVFIRRNARELLIGFFALATPLAIVSGLGGYVFYDRFGSLMASPDFASGEDFSQIGDFFGTYALWAALSLLSFALAQSIVAGFVRLYREGEQGEISVNLLWDETKRLILPTIGFTLSLGLLSLFVTSIVVVIGAALPGVLTLAALALWIGFFIWLIPFVHVAYASRMVESSSIAQAVSRTVMLLRGSWLPIFGALMLMWAVTIIALFAISMPLSIVMSTLGTTTTSTDVAAQMRVAGILSVPMQIIGLAAYILPALAAFFVHGRLVDEVEGAGVEDELDIFEEGIETAPNSSWNDAPSRGTAPEASGDPANADVASGEARRDGAQGSDDPGEAPSGGFRGGRFGS